MIDDAWRSPRKVALIKRHNRTAGIRTRVSTVKVPLASVQAYFGKVGDSWEMVEDKQEPLSDRVADFGRFRCFGEQSVQLSSELKSRSRLQSATAGSPGSPPLRTGIVPMWGADGSTIAPSLEVGDGIAFREDSAASKISAG